MTELRVRTDLIPLATQPPDIRAFAAEDQILSRLWVKAGQSASAPMTHRRKNVEERFAALAAEWRERCLFASSVTEMVLDPAYQEIVGLGEPVVPILLAELRDQPDHWMWALQSITGANPIVPEERGDLLKMANSWLTWGRAKGYDV